MAVTVKVNGKTQSLAGRSDTPLLYALRDQLELRGPHFGCGLAQCGACSVLVDGKEIRSCVTPISAVAGKSVTTLEGLPASYAKTAKKPVAKGALHPLQQAWIDEQVPQCGYCQNGMLIQAADLLATNPKPTSDEIKTAMNGHLCRCGTYQDIIRAVHRAAKEMA
jgi:aerobic-type carbon monoxide dehydrogenase small subunit (CoxS/CutS family)